MREVLVSMPNYVTKALQKSQHPTPDYSQYAPHQWTHPNYIATKKIANPLDTAPPILEEQKRRIQQIIETFLSYAQNLYCTMIPALNTLVEQQYNPTKNNEDAIRKFLDYAATNPSAIIQYKSSDMILLIESDASYLSEPWAQRRTGGHYYLISLPTDPEKDPNLPQPENGSIHTKYRVLKHVVVSTAAAEVRGLFHNGQTVVPLRITLHELGIPQPLTPIKTDSSAAEGIVTATVTQKKVPRQWTCNFIG